MAYRKPQQTSREQAQELMYDAMESDDEKRIKQLCQQALKLNPHCVDAFAMLANLECSMLHDYVQAMRQAVAAGRQDLGQPFFKEHRGIFWGLIETRPFMRAMASLVSALIEWGTPERLAEAIDLQKEMLDLNPNDNQGIRDLLVACYLRRKDYTAAAELLERYKNYCRAVPYWAHVLLAHATGSEKMAATLLHNARKQNPYVAAYLSGQKRRPRACPEYYSPGEETEAIFCAQTLAPAWQAHPKSKRWLKDLITPTHK